MGNADVVLKAIADDTRLKIVKLLLKHNYCVGALANRLELTQAAISQHLKVLREAGLLIGKKRGYFMHYDVDREQLRALAKEIEVMGEVEREACKPEEENCMKVKRDRCRLNKSGKECSEEVRFAEEEEDERNGNCKCNKS